MSEASSDFHLRSPPVESRRRRAAGGASADRSGGDGPLVDPGYFGEPYPLDPPLVDVRVPVRAPHAAATAYSRQGLMHRFPDAEVGDDLHILFAEPGKTGQSRLSPDVFVALDVPRRSTRADYDVDLLGPPDFVLEVLSQSTWKHDVGRKLSAYQRIGVRECVLFDVTGEDLAGVGKDLWGFALTPERREPLDEVLLPTGDRGVRSAVLGLVAYVAERTPPSTPHETWALTMRWRDPATAADIPDYDQARAGEAQARAEAQAESAKVRALEEQLRRLQAQAVTPNAEQRGFRS